MAERKAQNKYYPPDYDPEAGSLNRFVRQKKQSRLIFDVPGEEKRSGGFRVVRFEMPFNVWCGGCGKHIGMGVRFNAQKREVGMYHSTQILDFRMKCPECPNWFTITADPRTSEYECKEGVKRKVEEFSNEANETTKILDKEERLELQQNPFAKVEHQVKDKRSLQTAIPRLAKLLQHKDTISEKDFESNSSARKLFRERKRVEERTESNLRARLCLAPDFVLPKEDEQDLLEARKEFTKKNKRAKLVVHGNSKDPIIDVQDVKPGTATKILRHTSLSKKTNTLPSTMRRHLEERAPHLLSKK